MKSFKKRKDYFNQLAIKRQSRLSKYYWNDIIKHINYFSHPQLKVLEIGCGKGELLHSLNALEKVGIDFSEQMIAEGKRQFPELNLQIMDAHELNLNKKYDLIILSNLVGHLEDVQLVFNKLHSVCHDNTKLIISYYNFLWEPLLKFAEFIGLKNKIPEQNWLSQRDINNLLYLTGFHVYRNTKRMLLPVYIPLLSTLFNNFFAKLPLLRNLCINHFTFATSFPLRPEDRFKNKYSVSIVIPAKNEEGNIGPLLERIPKLGHSTEIIFVESDSSDHTWEKICELERRYNLPGRSIKKYRINIPGKFSAVQEGFEHATGDILMILDADLSVEPADLTKFYEAIACGKGDFINGSRLVYPMEKKAMRFINLMGNKIFSIIFSWLLDQRIKDTLCGTKVLFRNDYQLLKLSNDRLDSRDPFGDFELLFGGYKLNLAIIEIPVHYKERTYGSTNILRFKHGWKLLKACVFAARRIKFS